MCISFLFTLKLFSSELSFFCVIYQSPFYLIILFAFLFDFKEVSIHIFVERYLLESSEKQTCDKHAEFFAKLTERRREISRTVREIIVLSESTGWS